MNPPNPRKRPATESTHHLQQNELGKEISRLMASIQDIRDRIKINRRLHDMIHKRLEEMDELLPEEMKETTNFVTELHHHVERCYDIPLRRRTMIGVIGCLGLIEEGREELNERSQRLLEILFELNQLNKTPRRGQNRNQPDPVSTLKAILAHERGIHNNELRYIAENSLLSGAKDILAKVGLSEEDRVHLTQRLFDNEYVNEFRHGNENVSASASHRSGSSHNRNTQTTQGSYPTVSSLTMTGFNNNNNNNNAGNRSTQLTQPATEPTQ